MQDRIIRVWEAKAIDLGLPSSPDTVSVRDVDAPYRKTPMYDVHVSSTFYSREALAVLVATIERVLRDTEAPLDPVAVEAKADEPAPF